ncbi:hypothetical protein K3N28_09710 [Glycomyces sp. TRM65418]|uniref:hypothetical protein n=1 Tax=Glycomyces sp. TRM65418 TaxID=2867006 RepID=UPI001CE62D87|nr:hypothetical protein [Glycomyces sp. TRM65418]MCC3763347.1 hypothetical protein [Glycomyces sp. TRM65418]QZD57341.1 hypothetical protein K3N28_09650 [Glycomyces sp. TRM65418]
MTVTATEPRADNPVRAALRRWPTAIGIVFAVFTVWGLTSGVGLGAVVAASGLVYLGAAAVQRRGAAWPMFGVAFLVIAAADFTPWESDFGTWAVIGLAALLAVYGLLRGAARPAEGLPLQTLGMVAFGGIAALVLYVGEDLGSYLVAAGLLGHAAWDVYHHRKDIVVSRSLAEFCFVLDTLVAVVIIVVALRG